MADAERTTTEDKGFLGDVFQTRYREITPSAILFGVVFGIILNASITYAGLKIGFTIPGSTVAAVVGFGFLRGLLRQGSILETNIGQTIASSINAATPGIIFTVPVVYLLFAGDPSEAMTTERFWLITLAGVVGGLLGVVFIVPLRKQMIDIERLRFPTGTAVGAILKAPGAGPKKALVLLAGAIVAMLIYLPTELPAFKVNGEELPGYGSIGWTVSAPELQDGETLSREYDRDGDNKPDPILTDKSVDVGRWLGLPPTILMVFAIAPFAFGAGYLSGRAGLMVLAGGVLAFFVLNPTAEWLGWTPTTIHPDEVPNFGYRGFNRPLGIGMLLGGALMGVLASIPAIRAAFVSIFSAGSTKRGKDELGILPLAGLAVVGIVGLFGAAQLVIPNNADGGLLGDLPAYGRNVILAIVGAGWIWFASIIIAQCTGMTDWSPISGLALLTVVLIMLLAGKDQVVAAVMFGAALCVALSSSSDMMMDLRTGYIVGAQPRRQQLLEVVSVLIGPLVTMGTLALIVWRNLNSTDPQIPIGPGTDTTAPQAQALRDIIVGVQGGNLPYALYVCGAILGILLGLSGFPGLGVLVGLSMYLPIEYILTYGVGCVANMVMARIKGKQWAEEWGVPFCAGLIVGEAILAMVITIIITLVS